MYTYKKAEILQRIDRHWSHGATKHCRGPTWSDLRNTGWTLLVCHSFLNELGVRARDFCLSFDLRCWPLGLPTCVLNTYIGSERRIYMYPPIMSNNPPKWWYCWYMAYIAILMPHTIGSASQAYEHCRVSGPIQDQSGSMRLGVSNSMQSYVYLLGTVGGSGTN